MGIMRECIFIFTTQYCFVTYKIDLFFIKIIFIFHGLLFLNNLEMISVNITATIMASI